MNPRLKSVTPLENYKLLCEFKNGERKIFDINNLLDFGVFQELRDINYFKKVNPELGTVAWPNGQDICPDTLYLESVKLSD